MIDFITIMIVACMEYPFQIMIIKISTTLFLRRLWTYYNKYNTMNEVVKTRGTLVKFANERL